MSGRNGNALMRPLRLLALLAMVSAGPWAGQAVAAEEELWPALSREIFGDRQIAENDGVLTFFAPAAAEDAAIVPVSVRFPSTFANTITSLTLVVDRNPAPVAATVQFGEGFKAAPEIGERSFSTRIRIDSFSKVRAIAETADGKLHMASMFVSGAGGCSAPASKDMDEAMSSLGRIKAVAKRSPVHDPAWREATIMIRHPNFTGMQRDPKTGKTPPAMFVRDLTVKRGGDLVLRVEGGISISEDPNFKFNFAANGQDALEVSAKDTEGRTFAVTTIDGGS